MPTPIAPDLVTLGTFVFLGCSRPVGLIDYDEVLREFDRLLPLYEFVERLDAAPPIVHSQPKFEFRPGCSIKLSSTTAVLGARQLDVVLRHNLLQRALYEKLAKHHGADNVSTETTTAIGGRIDVVLRKADRYDFYEIKTYAHPRDCIREAIGQLLEYGLWPGSEVPERLVVVGEAPLGPDGVSYLERLNRNFPIPVAYEQLAIVNDAPIGAESGSIR